jgi:hypothetical protein
VITTKKPIATTTPKKPIKTSINKPSLNTNNSEKPSVRPSSVASSSSKPTQKKSSDISSSTTTTPAKKSIEPPPAKPSPVTFGKIPKLNPANKQNLIEKPTLSKSSTDQKPDLLATGGSTLPNNKESNTSEKNLSNRQRTSPKRPNRPQANPADIPDPFGTLSPMDLDESMTNIPGKQSSTLNQRYPSLLDSNPRLTSNFPRTNSVDPENTQSQSPLSPV